MFLKATSAYSPKGVPLYFSPLLLELFTGNPSFPLFSNGNLSKYLFDSKCVRRRTTFVNVLPLNYYTTFIYLFIHSFIHRQSFIIIVNLSMEWTKQWPSRTGTRKLESFRFEDAWTSMRFNLKFLRVFSTKGHPGKLTSLLLFTKKVRTVSGYLYWSRLSPVPVAKW